MPPKQNATRSRATSKLGREVTLQTRPSGKPTRPAGNGKDSTAPADPLREDGINLLRHAALLRHPDVASAIRDAIGGAPADALVDKRTCTGLGLTPRAFEEHGRSGSYPAFKSGRRLVAKRCDVEAWIASRRVEPMTTTTDAAKAVDDPRQDAAKAVQRAALKIARAG